MDLGPFRVYMSGSCGVILSAQCYKTCDCSWRYLFTKKRNAMNERKRVTQQKEEAEECAKGFRECFQAMKSS